MVATRHSLPNNAIDSFASGEDNDSDEDDAETSVPTRRKLKNALRKLQIDGEPALKGDSSAAEKPRGETYHWRGTTYVVTAGTRQEWIESQPERYKRRRNTMSSQMDGPDDEMPVSVSKRQRRAGKWHSSKERKLDNGEEEVEQEEQGEGDQAQGHGEDEYDEGVISARRSRRNVPPKYYGRRKRRPSDHTSLTPAHRDRQYRSAKMARGDVDEVGEEPEGWGQGDDDLHPAPKLPGYARADRLDPATRARRDEAEARGLEVHMLPEGIAKVKSMYEDRMVLNNLIQLAKMNAEVEKLKLQYEAAKANLTKALLRERAANASGGSVSDRANEGEQKPQSSATLQPEWPDHASSPAHALLEDQDMATPVSTHGEEVAKDTDTSEKLVGVATDSPIRYSSTACPDPVFTSRTASLTSLPPKPSFLTPGRSSQENIRPSTESTNEPKLEPKVTPLEGTGYPSRPTIDLPKTNRGGDTLRWSLTLSEHLGNGGRAEAHINYNRLDGESKTARRRRIKRETQLARAWDCERADSQQRRTSSPGGNRHSTGTN